MKAKNNVKETKPKGKKQRGGGAVKPGRHGFVPKIGTEEHMMEFLKRFVGGKN